MRLYVVVISHCCGMSRRKVPARYPCSIRDCTRRRIRSWTPRMRSADRRRIPGPGHGERPHLQWVPFTREQTLTAAVFLGGDQPLPTTPPKQLSPLCCIIESLTETESVIRFLDQHGLNAAEIRKAIGRCCADRRS